MNALRSIPLVGPWPLGIILGILILATLAGLLIGPKKRTITSFFVAVGLAVFVWVFITYLAHIIPDKLPWLLYAAGAVPAFLLIRTIAVKSKRVLWALLTVVTLVGSLGVINDHFSMYPSLGDLSPIPRAKVMSYQDFENATAAPTINGREVGAQVTIPLEGTTSHFGGRDAIAYVPPAYFDNSSLKLPVLVLMAGNPGSPDDWFRTGVVQKAADDFQQQHGGESPIVVSVDGTGSYAGNPVCVDGPRGNVQTYLSKDVPAQIKEKLRVDPNQKNWTIGGLSYGGTCSFQVVTNAPDSYGAFLNLSGQAHPTLDTHEHTVKQIFGGDESTFNAIDPEHILMNAESTNATTFNGIEGKFVAGNRDDESTTALTHLNDLSNKVGMNTQFQQVTGGHDFQTWRAGLDNNFAWVAARGGIQ